MTGEDAPQFETKASGFGVLTSAEREHGFDFQLKFATTVWSKEQKKQETLQLYPLAMQNPLVQQNPRALWMLLDRVWKAIGTADLQSIIPCPPAGDEPREPKLEWSMIQRGEEVAVNPSDDDDAHILDHRMRLERAIDQSQDRRDPPAEKDLMHHIIAHEGQKRAKMALQAMAQRIQAQLQAQQAQQQPGMQPGAPGAPQAVLPAPPLNAPEPVANAAPAEPPGGVNCRVSIRSWTAATPRALEQLLGSRGWQLTEQRLKRELEIQLARPGASAYGSRHRGDSRESGDAAGWL